MSIRNIKNLINYSSKPKLYTKGEKHFWSDPHIAKGMLDAHLNQSHDLASYREEKIQKIVDFSYSEINLKEGDYILDCGCGPGLYCERFYSKGLHVTGVDISPNSIEYAKKSAEFKKMNINYVCQNYLDINYKNSFDAAFIIWQDFCVLDYCEREKFLDNIYRALKPNGYLVLDVSTPKVEDKNDEHSVWSGYDSGFWSSNPHLVLENLFFYDNKHIRLSQYVIIEENRERIFRIYHQHYTSIKIKQLLKNHGFSVLAQYEDLTGEKMKSNSTTIGIFAQKGKKI